MTLGSIPVFYFAVILLFLALQPANNPVYGQEPERNENLDQQVKQFLEDHRDTWRDLNDSIVREDNGYGFPLEITTKEGEPYSFENLEEWDTFKNAFFAKHQKVKQGERDLKKQVFAANTLASLDVIKDVRT